MGFRPCPPPPPPPPPRKKKKKNRKDAQISSFVAIFKKYTDIFISYLDCLLSGETTLFHTFYDTDYQMTRQIE